LSPNAVDRLSLEPFETGGHPVHSRTLVVDVLQAGSGRVRADGTILDLRKHGWVPTGGELQTAGFIHHMGIDALVETTQRRIERFEPSQQVVAFEASERSAGDSCRDPIHRLRELAGERLDAGFVRRLRERFGGPLGCSHLLTLAQLMASTLPKAISLEEQAQRAHGPEREPDERVFKRIVFIDGFERSEGGMEVAIQLTDIHTAPRVAMEGVLDRFSSQHEVRVIARVDVGSMSLAAFDAAQRVRRRSELASASWSSEREVLAPLVGSPVLQGLAQDLLRRFGDDPARQTLLDALLQFAPGLIQCLATRASRLIEQRSGGTGKIRIPKEAGVGGFPDSCWMWRSDGRLSQLRQARVASSGDVEVESIDD